MRRLLSLSSVLALALLAPAITAQQDDAWEPVTLTTPDVWAVQALPGDRVLVASRGGLRQFAGGSARRAEAGGDDVAGAGILYGGAVRFDAAYAPGGYYFFLKRHRRMVEGSVAEIEMIESWRDLGSGGISFYGTLESAPGGRVWGVVASPDRRGWAAVDDNVWFYRGWDVTWERQPLPGDAAARSLHLGPDGALWAGTTAGLFRASGEGSGGEWAEVLSPDAFGGEPVTLVRERADGQVWAATASGRIVYGWPDADLWETTIVPAPLRALYLHTGRGLFQAGTFAATAAGLLHLPDGGETWTSALAGDILDVDGNGGGIWAALGTDGLVHSVDEGVSWESVHWQDVRTTRVAATYAAGPDGGSAAGTLLAGDRGSYGLFALDAQSETQGEWRAAGLGQTAEQSTRWIDAVTASPDGQFYAVAAEVRDEAFQSILYRSDDGARTWREAHTFAVPDGSTRFSVTALAAGPGRQVIAGVYTGPGLRHALYHSADAGATWAETISFDSARVATIAFGDDGRAYAGMNAFGSDPAGVYVSATGGRTWGPAQAVSATDALSSVGALAVAADGGVVAGVSADYAVRSGDGGATWQPIDGTAGIRALAKGPAGALVSTGSAVHRSADGGRTWAPLGDPGDYLDAVAVGPDGRAYVASSRSGLFRSAVTVVAAEPGALPEAAAAGLALSAARPNPASDQVQLVLTAGQAGPVQVAAFDVLGRQVAVLFDGVLAAGDEATVTLRARSLAPGPYVVRAAGGGQVAVRRVVVAR